MHSCRDNGSIVNEFSVDISNSYLKNVEFVVDDTYLLLQTGNNLLLILDVTNNRKGVYSEVIYPDADIRCILRPFYDPQEQRLLIKGDLDHDSICIDTKTWTKLARIPKMLGYDSETNMVYQMTVDPATAEHRIIATYFPPTDELIQIARSLVGIDYN
jgi:hypothetical protein